jgi:hypothetical protein
MAVCPNSAPAPTGSEVKWYTGTSRCEQHTVTSGEASAGGFALAATAEYGLIEAYISNALTTIGQRYTDANTWATESTGCNFVTYTGIAEDDVVTLYYIDITTALVAISNAQDVDTSISADSDSQAVAGEYRKLQTVGAADQTMTVNQLFCTETFMRKICGDNYTAATTADGDPTLVVSTSHKTVFNKVDAIVGKRLDASSRIQRKWGLFGVQATSLTQNHPVSAGQANINASFIVDYEISAEWSYST